MDNTISINSGVHFKAVKCGVTRKSARTREIVKKIRGGYGPNGPSTIVAETNIGNVAVKVKINTVNGTLTVTPGEYADVAIRKLRRFLNKKQT